MSRDRSSTKSCWPLCGSERINRVTRRKTDLELSKQSGSPSTNAVDHHEKKTVRFNQEKLTGISLFSLKNRRLTSSRKLPANKNADIDDISSPSAVVETESTSKQSAERIIQEVPDSNSRRISADDRGVVNEVNQLQPCGNRYEEQDVQGNGKADSRETVSSVKLKGSSVNQKYDSNGLLCTQTADAQLRSAIGYCERRLECLQSRLKWFRNSTSQSTAIEPHRTGARWTSAPSTPLTTGMQNEAGDNQECELVSVEKQINSLATKLRQLKCQIESYAYLSWLGAIADPQTNRVAVPGRSCPLPNPQLHLIRRSDAECRATMEEFKDLCQRSVPEEVRLELREPTFSNWPWSDGWLIRFVRQMFSDLGFVEHFQLKLSRLDLWLFDVYRRYNRVPFHNFKHAFMVTQMAYTIIWLAQLRVSLEAEEQMALIVAAICHDLDHPGFNNAYQINAGTELAIRYNDQSPLENHHAAMAFDILSHNEINPFIHLGTCTYRRIREEVIRCILATDMSRHNDILNQFMANILGDLDNMCSLDPETGRPIWSVDKTKRDLVMMILIKVCDISNESRPLTVSGPWINRLLAEFFHQSDYEKLVGLPVAPFMDRDKVTKSASQCGFIRFVILPLFEAVSRLLSPLKVSVLYPAIEQLAHYSGIQFSEEHSNQDEIDKQHDEATS